MYPAEQVSLVLTYICSRSSPNVKRNEQDETFVIFLSPFVSETESILQVTSCNGMFNSGSPLLTRR
jgi:hypothetical protein